MPLLYESAKQRSYVLAFKLKQPLTSKQKQRLLNCKSLMEQEANIIIHKIETTPNAVLIYCTPVKSFFIITMSVLTAIAVIAAAIGIPLTAWFITQAPATGPLGLPVYFWVGLGIGIPIFGLALTVWMMRK